MASKHQNIAPLLVRVDVRFAIDQQLNALNMPILGRVHQRRLLRWVVLVPELIRIRARIEQRRGDFKMSLLAGHRQRGAGVLVIRALGIHVGVVLDESFHGVQIAKPARKHQAC